MANQKKSHLGWWSVLHLGFVIGHGQVRAVQGKTAALQRVHSPQTKKEFTALLRAGQLSLVFCTPLCIQGRPHDRLFQGLGQEQ